MSGSGYYLADAFTDLSSNEAQAMLVQRLRQYLEIRRFTVLLGNGCSIPLGAPLIHDVAAVLTDFDKTPYRLAEFVSLELCSSETRGG